MGCCATSPSGAVNKAHEDCPKPAAGLSPIVSDLTAVSGRSLWVRTSSSSSSSSSQGNLTHVYEVMAKPIGQGNYGSVHVVTHKTTGEKRAVKKLSKVKLSAAGETHQCTREISIMMELDHPNLCRIFETFETAKEVLIVLELCTGGELFDKLESKERFSEKEACNIMKQALHAVCYMHELKICHRDLKADNFLLCKPTPLEAVLVKIIDFGTALHFRHEEPLTECIGTAYYMAPQILEREYSHLCDLWACGVLMYVMLCGNFPFEGESYEEIFDNIREGEVVFDEEDGWDGVSQGARDLVLQLLEYEEHERIPSSDALADPWVKANASRLVTGGYDETPPPLLDNCRRFAAANPLKRASMCYIACHADEDRLAPLRDIFVELDIKGYGTLDFSQMAECLKNFDPNIGEAELRHLVREVDRSGDGKIHYSEFLTAGLDRSDFEPEDTARHAFRRLNQDQDGKLKVPDLRKFCQEFDSGSKREKHDVKEFSELVRRISSNGSSSDEISFDNFLKMMRTDVPFTLARPEHPQIQVDVVI